MRLKNFPSNAKMRLQRGAVAVELAFVIIVMLFIVAGIIEFGRVFWYADALTKATRDGARLMSNWPVANLNSGGVGAAKNLAATAATAANVRPNVATNVVVECLGPSPGFSVVACVDGTAPANVRVSITGFNVVIGTMVPFIKVYGGSFGNVPLSPYTTMRYMN
jgi:Flp pilus assembly protein TadG